jgi:hypothetical protein
MGHCASRQPLALAGPVNRPVNRPGLALPAGAGAGLLQLALALYLALASTGHWRRFRETACHGPGQWRWRWRWRLRGSETVQLGRFRIWQSACLGAVARRGLRAGATGHAAAGISGSITATGAVGGALLHEKATPAPATAQGRRTARHGTGGGLAVVTRRRRNAERVPPALYGSGFTLRNRVAATVQPRRSRRPEPQPAPHLHHTFPTKRCGSDTLSAACILTR